jgi:hypothetical protein
MNLYIVTCNNGFKSEPMDYAGAYRYAKALRKLGNYGVKVVEA